MRTEKDAMGKVSGCTMKGQEAITEKKKKEPEVTAEKRIPKWQKCGAVSRKRQRYPYNVKDKE